MATAARYKILVIDRDSLEVVSRNRVDAWYQWHFGNGYVDPDGNVVFDLVRYDDLATNQYLGEVITGKPRTKAVSEFWQIRLQPRFWQNCANATAQRSHL
jgi:all-trans-8'-apo-beta-carotenal 15,15'-oxygenase